MSMLSEQSTQVSIVHLAGALRAPLPLEFRRNIDAIIARGEPRIVLNLAQLVDVDAAGIGELVRAFNAVRAAGGVLRIVHATRRISHLLRIAGVWPLLTTGAGAWSGLAAARR